MSNRPGIFLAAAWLALGGTAAAALDPVPAPLAPVLTERSKPGAAVPRGHLADWITMADYPAMARARRESGITRFMLLVAPSGVPSECQILSSSGSVELDKATCDLAMQRARFDPAIDAAGKPVLGYYSGHIHWDPAKLRPTPLPGTLVRSYIVEADGSQSNCRIESATGAAAARYRAGPGACLPWDRYFGPYFDAGGKPVRKRITVAETIAVSEVP